MNRCAKSMFGKWDDDIVKSPKRFIYKQALYILMSKRRSYYCCHCCHKQVVEVGGEAVCLLKFIFEGSPVARRSLDMSPTLDLTDSPPGAITAACIAKYGCSRFNFPEPVNLDLSPSSLSHFKRLPLWQRRDC